MKFRYSLRHTNHLAYLVSVAGERVLWMLWTLHRHVFAVQYAFDLNVIARY